MRIPVALTLASLLALCACDKDENAGPRPPLGEDQLVGQEFHFKVKTEDWIVNGLPGDDTYGFAAKSTVNILTEGILENGTVRVYLKRASGNWAELPQWAHQGAPHGANWNYTLHPEQVKILIDRNGEAFAPPEEMMTFRVVVFGG